MVKTPFSGHRKTPKQQAVVGTLLAAASLAFFVADYDYKNEYILQFAFVPRPNFGYDKDRALPF